MFEIDLIGKQRPVRGTEGAERIRSEQDFVCRVIGHHDLRPVDHRGVHKREGMHTAAEGIPLVHDLAHAIHVKGEILFHHDGKLLIADYLHVRITPHQLFKRGAVIRLHMMDDDVIQVPSGERVRNVLEEYAADSGVYGIKQDRLLVQQ